MAVQVSNRKKPRPTMLRNLRKVSSVITVVKVIFYQELLKEKSNPRLKGSRKGIIVKSKEFYIPILNTKMNGHFWRNKPNDAKPSSSKVKANSASGETKYESDESAWLALAMPCQFLVKIC